MTRSPIPGPAADPVTAIGVDLGGTKLLVGTVDVDGTVLEARKVPTPRTGVSDVVEAIASLVAALGPGPEPIGVGVPGMVRHDGTVSQAPNLVGFDRPVALAPLLEQRLGRPVRVDNDVNVAALAEHRLGAARGHPDVVVLSVGTGVGGALILGGQLRRGPNGMAGEVGHLTVRPGGEPCGCGGAGHLEAYVGRAGLERRARQRHAEGRRTLLVELSGDQPMKSKIFARALQRGDQVASQLIAEAADVLALGIGNLAAVLDVPRFVVGGGLGERLGDPFLERVRTSAAFGGFGAGGVELVMAQRLTDAGVVGAAMLALDTA